MAGGEFLGDPHNGRPSVGALSDGTDVTVDPTVAVGECSLGSGHREENGVQWDLNNVRQELEEQSAEIARLREAVAAYRRSEGRMAKLAQRLQQDLSERDLRIEALEARLRTEQVAASRMQVVPIERIADLEAAARNLQAAVRAREARLGELEALADAQAVHIAGLEQQDARAALQEQEAELAKLRETVSVQAARLAQLEAQRCEPQAHGTPAVPPGAVAGAEGRVAASTEDACSESSSATCAEVQANELDVESLVAADARAAEPHVDLGASGGAVPPSEREAEEFAGAGQDTAALGGKTWEVVQLAAAHDVVERNMANHAVDAYMTAVCTKDHTVDAYTTSVSTKEASMAAIAAAVAGVLGTMTATTDRVASCGSGPVVPQVWAQVPPVPALGGFNCQEIVSVSQNVSVVTEQDISRGSSPMPDNRKAASPPNTPPATLLGGSDAGSACKGSTGGTGAGQPATQATFPTPRLSPVGSSISASPVLSARDGTSPGADKSWGFSPGTSAGHLGHLPSRGLGGSISGGSIRGGGSISGSLGRGSAAGAGACSPLAGHGHRSPAAVAGAVASASRPEGPGARPRPPGPPGQPAAVGGLPPPTSVMPSRGMHPLVSPKCDSSVASHGSCGRFAGAASTGAPVPSMDPRLRSLSPLSVASAAAEPQLRSLSPLPGTNCAVRLSMPGVVGQGAGTAATGKGCFAVSPRLQAASSPRGSPGPPLREARASTARRSVPRGAWIHP